MQVEDTKIRAIAAMTDLLATIRLQREKPKNEKSCTDGMEVA